MTSPHMPFIITLTKQTDGYRFHSLEEQQLTSSKPTKKAKSNPNKNPALKNSNRLIKEIALISDPTPFPPQDNNPQPSHLQEDIDKNEVENAVEEEEIDCQIKRKVELPKSPAKWFYQNSIDQIEKQNLPEFFDKKGYKTPELYLKYRNFMIDAYHRNPKRHLTFISCRKVLRGDANCLLRVYNFLVKVGVINYCVGVDGNYTFKSIPIDKTQQIVKRPQSCIKHVPQQSEETNDKEIDTDSLTLTVINKHFSRTFRVYCNNCKLICGVAWFAFSLDDEKQRNLCFDCYNSLEKQATSGYQKVDILKKLESNGKQAKSSVKTAWNIDDNIKLLDYMSHSENYGWSQLINLFEGKKSIQDIIIQFMQFPITNFDLKQAEKQFKPEQIQYQNDQWMDLLGQFYEKSAYAQETMVEEIKEEDETVVPQSRGILKITKLILEKYVSKMNNLKTIEKLIDESNVAINQQNFMTRAKVSSQSLYNLNNEEREEEGNQSNYD